MPPPELLLCGKEKIQKQDQEVVGGVGSESESEGEMECGGTARITNRGILRLHEPIKT